MAETNPRPLTFSQAQGYEPIPGPLALEKISEEARNKLWSTLHTRVGKVTDRNFVQSPWVDILSDLHIDFLGRPSDEFTPHLNLFVKEYKERFLRTEPFNKVFDILEMVMRHRKCPPSFIHDITAAFEDCRLAYFVDRGFPVMILPAATPEEGATIRNALEDVRAAGLPAAESHLRESGRLINAGEWAGSVRESIHAVESVARRIAPEAEDDALTKALDKIDWLPPALKSTMGNLYGYASREHGIRHALVNEATSSAQQEEAVLMLGACASFVSYMLRKHRQEQPAADAAP